VSALYAWLRRHPKLVDGVLAFPLAFGGLVPDIAFHRYLMIPVTLCLTLPLILRRTHPVGAFGTAVTAGAVQVAADIRISMPDFAIVILLYTLAAYTSRRTSVAGLAVCLTGSLTEAARLPLPPNLHALTRLVAGSLMFAGPSLIAWVLGDSMRYRRAYYANLEERAARLERDRDAQAQIAAAAERARIARELHDVVAHNVSVMVVQADGAAYAMGSDPHRVREALTAISATGRQALTEMRVLLGVLRKTDDAGQPALTPVPGLAQLDELLDQTRAAGLAVSCTVQGPVQPLPVGIALTAYRIVQESLTNTRKHGGLGASARVQLRHAADSLELTITDDGLGAAAVCDGAGHGLAGMRERAALYGGSVQARPLPGRGFQVSARLPLSTATATAAPAASPAASQADRTDSSGTVLWPTIAAAAGEAGPL